MNTLISMETIFHGESTAQKKLSVAQAEIDRKQCERSNGDIVLYETCGQLESQRVQFYQAKQLTTELAIWRIRDEK